MQILSARVAYWFLYFNYEDDILKKSEGKILETAKVIVIVKLSILRFFFGFHR